MSDLGQLLKKARIEKKISLDELQETTKIRKRYLEAIEDGDYSVLPGNFYVRAFIKNYAEAVGLDPNEVLQMYQNVIPAADPEPIEPIRSKRSGVIRNTEYLGKWATNIMVIAFVVLILGVVYYFMNLNYKGGTTDASNQMPKKITEKVEPVAPKPETTTGTSAPGALANTLPKPAAQPIPVPAAPTVPASEVKLAKSERGTDFYTVSGTDKLKIEVRVTGDACWTKVDSLGAKREVLIEKTLNGGTTQTWEFSNPAYFRFGKANAVELVINGTTVPVGDEPNVKNIQVDFQTSNGVGGVQG